MVHPATEETKTQVVLSPAPANRPKMGRSSFWESVREQQEQNEPIVWYEASQDQVIRGLGANSHRGFSAIETHPVTTLHHFLSATAANKSNIPGSEPRSAAEDATIARRLMVLEEHLSDRSHVGRTQKGISQSTMVHLCELSWISC